MNRSLTSVILGGFGNKPVQSNTAQDAIAGVHTETNIDQVADLMNNSKSIIITPGRMKKCLHSIYRFNLNQIGF